MFCDGRVHFLDNYSWLYPLVALRDFCFRNNSISPEKRLQSREVSLLFSLMKPNSNLLLLGTFSDCGHLWSPAGWSVDRRGPGRFRNEEESVSRPLSGSPSVLIEFNLSMPEPRKNGVRRAKLKARMLCPPQTLPNVARRDRHIEWMQRADSTLQSL
jgi:hypothetical protein